MHDFETEGGLRDAGPAVMLACPASGLVVPCPASSCGGGAPLSGPWPPWSPPSRRRRSLALQWAHLSPLRTQGCVKVVA